jgi:hypothetical protein
LSKRCAGVIPAAPVPRIVTCHEIGATAKGAGWQSAGNELADRCQVGFEIQHALHAGSA